MLLSCGSQFFPQIWSTTTKTKETRKHHSRYWIGANKDILFMFIASTTNITNVRTDCGGKTWTQCTFLFQGEATLIEFREEHFHVWAWFCTLFYVLDDSLFTANALHSNRNTAVSTFVLRNINFHVLLVFVIFVQLELLVFAVFFWWMHFIFNEILDSRAFM